MKGEREEDDIRVEDKRGSAIARTLPQVGGHPTDNNSKTHTALTVYTPGTALGPLSTHFTLTHSLRPVLSLSPWDSWGLTQRG